MQRKENKKGHLRKQVESKNKREYAGEATKEFIYEADKYDVEFPIPPEEKGMKNKLKWFALGALAVALLVFSQSARAIEKDACLYTEGVPCKESL